MLFRSAIGMGVGVSVVPELFANLPAGLSILVSNGIVAGSVTAIVLNILFNMIGPKPKDDPMHS